MLLLSAIVRNLADFSVIFSFTYANSRQLQITILLDLVKFALFVSVLGAICVNVLYILGNSIADQFPYSLYLSA